MQNVLPIVIVAAALSGCAIAVEQLPPPPQPEPVTERLTEYVTPQNGAVSAAPGDTLLRARDYDVRTQVIRTNMWKAQEDFTIDAPAWPEFSVNTEQFYVATGRAKWRRDNYLVLDDEDGNIS